MESFLHQLNEAERFFEIMEVSEEYNVAIVAYKLKGWVGVWQQSMCDECYQLGQPPIRDCIIIKRIIAKDISSQRLCACLAPTVFGVKAIKSFCGCLY